MAIRFYILPIEIDANGHRGAKYFISKHVPTGVSDTYGLEQYGFADGCLLMSDLTPEQHIELTSNADVLAVPAALDAPLTAGQVTAVTNFLEGMGIPANWINTATTPREALRAVFHMFKFSQNLQGKIGKLSVLKNNLDTNYNDLPVWAKTAILETAQAKELDTTKLSLNPTVRQILKFMQDKFQDVPFTKMGVTV